jgi:hypothetical protein
MLWGNLGLLLAGESVTMAAAVKLLSLLHSPRQD